MMKKILVACGTGMSTSTMIAQKLQDFLAEQGIAATTAQCCLNEIPLNCNGMDLIVTSMRTHSDYGIPTLNGARPADRHQRRRIKTRNQGAVNTIKGALCLITSCLSAAPFLCPSL